MKLRLMRTFHSLACKNILTFLIIVALIVIPLVYAYVKDIEQALSDSLAERLALAAQRGRTLINLEEVTLVNRPGWVGTHEYENLVRMLNGIQKNFSVDNAVIYRRLPNRRFVYVADGNGDFAINELVRLHERFPQTYQTANEAWETGGLGNTRLFTSGNSKWFQVNLPLKVDGKVVAQLMLNKFATPIAREIENRQIRIIIAISAVLAVGSMVWGFLTWRRLRALHLLQTASQEIASGSLDVEIPITRDRSEVGKLTDTFRKMVSDLRASQAEIEQYHRTLEQRIQQRTREIHNLLEAQLRQAQRLEAIGTLAGGIAHDLNNILTPILGYTELALEGVAPNSKEHRDISMVGRAAFRAKDLIAQILQFSRQSEEIRRPIDLASLVSPNIS